MCCDGVVNGPGMFLCHTGGVLLLLFFVAAVLAGVVAAVAVAAAAAVSWELGKWREAAV